MQNKIEDVLAKLVEQETTVKENKTKDDGRRQNSATRAEKSPSKNKLQLELNTKITELEDKLETLEQENFKLKGEVSSKDLKI